MDSRRAQIADGVLTTVPTLVFVVASKVSTVRTALVWTLLLSFMIVLARLVRREPLLHAWIGCLIAVIGGVAALMTGEARGYFLLSAILPAVITVICLVSIIVGRPLAGMLLNGLAGGSKQWYRSTRLRRLYANATWVCAGVNVATTILQKVFYSNNQTARLAVVHVGTGPIFAAIMAVTIAAARRRRATEGTMTTDSAVQEDPS